MLPNPRILPRVAAALLGFGTAAGILAFPDLALAQNYDELGTYGPRANSAPKQSEQRFTLELRVGPYLPNVDSEPGLVATGEHPFTDTFTTKKRVALGVEFDWMPIGITDILRVGLAGAVMYTAFGADPHYADGAKEVAPDQKTKLKIFPHWAGGVLRIDALARKTPVPVVFAVKGGLAQALWWTGDVPKNSDVYGIKGRGRSYGYYYGAGAYLDLGFIDEVGRKRMDNFLGINHTYFFGEYYQMKLEGFGSGKPVMHLSDRSWVLGLAFDI
ncbi:MAG TPA: MXAN_2562 family outer membrane beta-barrel protein [Polyangiaceae bacterium]|nr:MXAN_2562 family outer membrane beta-barrel protein [Polyangiaceae bacterium]